MTHFYKIQETSFYDSKKEDLFFYCTDKVLESKGLFGMFEAKNVRSNKHVKRESYAVPMEKTKEVFPVADEKFVKSKIESLRASFRRELKKLEGIK
nr:unnamed protein product [Callosobruchus analis]